MNHLKSVEIVWNHLIFVFKTFNFFSLISKAGKSKIIKTKILIENIEEICQITIFLR